MALINCPECNREISDKAESCPHCGFLLKQEIKDNIYDYNEKQYDISGVLQLLQKGNVGVAEITFYITLGIKRNDENKLLFEQVRNDFNSGIYKIRCPKCGSSDFEMVKKNWNIQLAS
jgi:Zn finger protein HypA/HybF involved in hydrogenase expression